MKRARPGLPVAWILIFVIGMGSGGALVVSLGRRIAREREVMERSETKLREAESRLAAERGGLREARERIVLLEAEGAARSRVVEGELATLRRDLSAAVKERDALAEKYRAAASERDRVLEQALADRRSLEGTRTDLVKAAERAGAAEESSRKAVAAAAAAERRLREGEARVAALLRPLLQDLRSPDGTLRVRAHEALCAWAGRELAYRPNGSPAEIEADAAALEKELLR